MPRKPRRFLLYCLAAVIPAAGLMATSAVSAGATTRPSASASAQAASAARTAIEKLSIGQHPAVHQVSHAAKGLKALTQAQSTNWAGYADTGSSFTKISSSWTEPSATCTSGAEQLAAFWVGIDGYTSSSVEQDGTVIECYQGTAYQYTWWEMYPTNAIQVVGSSLKAGDKITSSVVRSGSTYTLKVTDSTHTANSFTKTETCSSCANSSVEWIAEAPSNGSSIEPLAHFSTWTNSNSSVTEGSTTGTISSFTDDEITMIDSSNRVKATPSSLNGAGTQFSVTWNRAS